MHLIYVNSDKQIRILVSPVLAETYNIICNDANMDWYQGCMPGVSDVHFKKYN